MSKRFLKPRNQKRESLLWDVLHVLKGRERREWALNASSADYLYVRGEIVSMINHSIDPEQQSRLERVLNQIVEGRDNV